MINDPVRGDKTDRGQSDVQYVNAREFSEEFERICASRDIGGVVEELVVDQM